VFLFFAKRLDMGLFHSAGNERYFPGLQHLLLMTRHEMREPDTSFFDIFFIYFLQASSWTGGYDEMEGMKCTNWMHSSWIVARPSVIWA
jgi:hypothetical protein